MYREEEKLRGALQLTNKGRGSGWGITTTRRERINRRLGKGEREVCGTRIQKQMRVG